MEDIIQKKWDEILEYLKIEHGITDVSFRTWLQALDVFSVVDHLITISINDSKIGDSKKYIVNKFGIPLKVSIEEIIGESFDIEFELSSDLKNRQPAPAALVKSKQEPSNDLKYPFLNPRYTFETFVVGNNNSLAHAASLAVAEAPAEVYNPLFIYGGVGLGKTHLMHSIAHYILAQNPNTKVLYVTSETFTNELIEAIRNRSDTTSIAEFRKKYRNIDVLLIDDIQFIIGKESTQEEFFHTFNTLHESKKQIIISSDKPPKEFETLEERLRSRFEWGLPVDIQSPDYETRMAILKKKEELDGLSIDNEVLKYIATNIKSNIRELEGALTKIVALSRLKNKDVDVVLAEEALKDLISPNNKRDITVELISEIIAEHFGIQPTDIVSSKKSRNIAYPRQISMYLCRELTDLSLKDIGKKLGNRDHTTVLHGIMKIQNDLETDDSLQNTIGVLKKKINPQ
ncbi:chromosomal replication initiator protein DnaA [Anaeromicropila populeti]|uniref:Chromosomal replication initiator protein DnaA n=1 Tax=Anaeromicropila populeti TaxID=37658 RepID=A0A1I6LMP3_9FIRM|nr:chromosomal replication initiator protein DnaA [Anaeromicropila populeti]SFS04766.1 chromosomal replication initiator protein [Anaeromicropila populeti]